MNRFRTVAYDFWGTPSFAVWDSQSNKFLHGPYNTRPEARQAAKVLNAIVESGHIKIEESKR